MAGKYNETAWRGAERLGALIEQFVWNLLAHRDLRRLELAPALSPR